MQLFFTLISLANFCALPAVATLLIRADLCVLKAHALAERFKRHLFHSQRSVQRSEERPFRRSMLSGGAGPQQRLHRAALHHPDLFARQPTVRLQGRVHGRRRCFRRHLLRRGLCVADHSPSLTPADATACMSAPTPARLNAQGSSTWPSRTPLPAGAISDSSLGPTALSATSSSRLRARACRRRRECADCAATSCIVRAWCPLLRCVFGATALDLPDLAHRTQSPRPSCTPSPGTCSPASSST